MKQTLFFSFMILSSIAFSQSNTYTVYLPVEQTCNSFTIELNGKKYVIGGLLSYSRTSCSKAEYLKAKKVKYLKASYHQLGGKNYFYDGQKFYDVNDVTKTCGWPITVAAFNKLRGFD